MDQLFTDPSTVRSSKALITHESKSPKYKKIKGNIDSVLFFGITFGFLEHIVS